MIAMIIRQDTSPSLVDAALIFSFRNIFAQNSKMQHAPWESIVGIRGLACVYDPQLRRKRLCGYAVFSEARFTTCAAWQPIRNVMPRVLQRFFNSQHPAVARMAGRSFSRRFLHRTCTLARWATQRPAFLWCRLTCRTAIGKLRRKTHG